jgi:hypothetical protein
MTQKLRQKDIWHLVERGIVAEVTFDTETADVNRSFNAILECGMVVSDLGGRVVTTHSLQGRVPDYRTVSPQAALVNRRSPAEWDQGDTPAILAGKIAEIFQKANYYLYDSLTLEQKITPEKNGKKATKPETVRLIKYEKDNGEIGHLRLHDGGKYLSFPVDRGHADYHDEGGQGWRKKRAGIQVNHYYGIRADDPWLWGLFDQANMPDLFLTHTKQSNSQKSPAWRTDIYKMAQMVYCFGPRGEQGLETVTNGNQVSFKLEDLMQANTHAAVPARGVAEGVRMPDQSIYNPAKGHQSALYDALATLGFKNYLRQIAPDLVIHAEKMADLGLAREFVQGQNGFDDNPVVGLGRVIAGQPDPVLVMLVGMDEHAADRKDILTIRLDRDLGNYRYRGKKLVDMSADELAGMMQEQKNHPDSIFDVASLRKNPLLVTAETAAPVGHDFETIEENRRYVLSNPGLVARVLVAFAKTQPVFPTAEQIANPLPEDEIFSQIGDLPRYQLSNDRQQWVDVPENIHFHADNVYRHQTKIDLLMKKIIAPDPIEWREDDPVALENFKLKIKNTTKSLATIETERALPLNLLSAASIATSTERAVSLLWQIRKALVSNFYDTSRHYEVLDTNGNAIAFDHLAAMNGRERQARFDSKLLTIQFDTMPSRPTARKIARQFWDAGRIDQLGPEWSEFMMAEIAIYQHGEPMRDVDHQRLMTGPRALKEITRILQNNNAKTGHRADPVRGETGDYDRFAARTNRAPEILGRAAAAIQEKMDRFALTPARMVMMGWDPRTKSPIDAIEHEISGDNLLVIDLPGPVLQKPLSHPALPSSFVLLVPPPDQQLEKALAAGSPVAFRAVETGRLYLAAGAFLQKAPDPKGFDAIYQQAAADYADAGYQLTLPDASLRLVGFEGLHPLANTRQIDDRMSSLRLPGALAFDSLVSTRFSLNGQSQGLPLAGIMLRQYEYVPTLGDVRLIEVDEKGAETGWELAGRVQATQTISLRQLRLETKRGEWPEDRCQRYGYANPSHMMAGLSALFNDELIRPDRDTSLLSMEQVMIVDLAPVDRNSMAWNPHHIVPEASLTRDFLDQKPPSFDINRHLAPSMLRLKKSLLPAPPQQRRL